MSRDGYWHPLDPRTAAAASNPDLARRFSLRPPAEAKHRRDQLATVDQLRRYVEAELATLPGGWQWRARASGRPLWQLQPPLRQSDECGHDLVLLPEPRLFLLTHSNHRSGDWHVERLVVGTTANFLEVEALVQFTFELRDFIRLVTATHPQNFDSPT